MNLKLLFSTAIASTILVNLPANALTTTNSGGTINFATTTDFNFSNISGVDPASIVTLNIASISSVDLSGLTLILSDPTNTVSLTLVDQELQSGSFDDVTFDDTAGNDIASQVPPYSGLYKPSDLSVTFGDFNSLPSLDGIWTLRITSVNGSNDSLGLSTLNFTTPVPFEFNPALGLLALGGLVTAQKVVSKFKSRRP